MQNSLQADRFQHAIVKKYFRGKASQDRLKQLFPPFALNATGQPVVGKSRAQAEEIQIPDSMMTGPPTLTKLLFAKIERPVEVVCEIRQRKSTDKMSQQEIGPAFNPAAEPIQPDHSFVCQVRSLDQHPQHRLLGPHLTGQDGARELFSRTCPQ